MTTENKETETYSEMMHRRMIEYEAHKNDPRPPKTTCKNHACALHNLCNHNILKDGLTCAGNVIGFRYKSAQEAIYADYVADCEQKRTEPMCRFHYFEF